MKAKKLIKMYNKFNDEYFNSELPETDIALCYLDDAYAYTIAEEEMVNIILFDRNLEGKEYETTMLHEMIHVWQHTNKLKMDHGKNFKKVAKRIRASRGMKRGAIL